MPRSWFWNLCLLRGGNVAKTVCPMKSLGLSLCLCVLLPAAMASTATTWDEALGYYRAKQYDKATKGFARLKRTRAHGADACYMLAKIYWERPNRNVSEASRLIKEALQQKPNDVRFIQERLRQLRSSESFLGSEKIKEDERLHWGKRILARSLHPALGHEELGIVFAERYARWAHVQRRRPNRVLERKVNKALEQAFTHLEAAIEQAPERPYAYPALVRLSLQTGEYLRGWEGVQQMQQTQPEAVETWLYAGVLEHAMQQHSAAETSFKRAQRRFDTAARVQFEQLALLLTDEERQQFTADAAHFENRYWSHRDPLHLTDHNERLIAHYARLTYSDLLYPKWRAHTDDAWNITPGDMIVRYGLPLQTMRYTTVSARGIPTWHLQLELPGASLGFVDEFGHDDFLIPSTALAGAVDGVTNARDMIRELPERADALSKPTYTIPYLASRFLEPSGAYTVYTTFGIPVNPDAGGAILPASVTLGAFLVDDQGAMAARHIQEQEGLPRVQVQSVDTLHFWTESFALQAPAGDYQLSVEAEGAEHVSVNRSEVQLPEGDTGVLAISDIMLALSIEPAGDNISTEIVREGLAIEPTALRLLPRERPIYLYFETYHLVPGADGQVRYSIEAVLAPREEREGLADWLLRRRNDEAGVSVRYTQEDVQTRLGHSLILDAKDEEPGTYRLLLTVRDLVSGEEVQTYQELVLR